MRYETDMGPELSTIAVDQNFAWIYKQHQDLIGLVLIFRTKMIWSWPEFGLVRCGYLNAAIKSSSVAIYAISPGAMKGMKGQIHKRGRHG